MRAAELKINLELFVDSNSMQEILTTLSEIAYEKAEHVRTNWQDEKLAKVWERTGANISKVLSNVTV